jgi:hypothetical protein
MELLSALPSVLQAAIYRFLSPHPFVDEIKKRCSITCLVCSFAFHADSFTYIAVKMFFRGQHSTLGDKVYVCGGCLNREYIREFLLQEFYFGEVFLYGCAATREWGPVFSSSYNQLTTHREDEGGACAHCVGLRAAEEIERTRARLAPELAALHDVSPLLRSLLRPGARYLLRRISPGSHAGHLLHDSLVTFGQKPHNLPTKAHALAVMEAREYATAAASITEAAWKTLPGSRCPRAWTPATVTKMFGDFSEWPESLHVCFPVYEIETRALSLEQDLAAAVFADDSAAAQEVLKRMEACISNSYMRGVNFEREQPCVTRMNLLLKWAQTDRFNSCRVAWIQKKRSPAAPIAGPVPVSVAAATKRRKRTRTRSLLA